MSNYKSYRIDGILPEDISNEIIFFSHMPGENDDGLIIEVDHHDNHNNRAEHGEAHIEHECKTGRERKEKRRPADDKPIFDTNIDFLDLIVLKHDCWLVQVWHMLYIICCLTSGYYYGWLALFGTDFDNPRQFAAILIFECIFTVQILINFLTEYIPEGEVIPVRNLS